MLPLLTTNAIFGIETIEKLMKVWFNWTSQAKEDTKMAHPAVIIGRKTFNLRCKFKKLEKTARKNGHARRVKFYHFIQTRLKCFGNWLFTIWSEETQELMRNYPLLYSGVRVEPLPILPSQAGKVTE